MNHDLEKFVKNIPLTSNQGGLIPNNIKENLENLGTKGGQKYSDLVDKIIDLIFKK